MSRTEMLEAIKRSRKGAAKIATNTTARVNEQTGAILIRHYETDILRLYADGSRDVCALRRCISDTTIDRLGTFGRVSIERTAIPIINGRLTIPEKVYTIRSTGSSETVVFNAKNEYIRINACDGIDMSTVAPVEVKYVHDKKELNRLRKQGQEIYRVARFRSKLGEFKDSPVVWNGGTIASWVAKRIGIPHDEIDFCNIPRHPASWVDDKNCKDLGDALLYHFRDTLMRTTEILCL